MNSSRRRFLQSAGFSFLALGLPPPFLLRAAHAGRAGNNKVLVVVFQRGGMDGLNAVIPFGDRAYDALRPSIAIASPASGEGGAIDLDGFYGLHPALAPLKRIYDDKHLAIVHACGSPDNTRSHFDAQDYMELGTPGIKSTPDGWLNRHLAVTSANPSPFRAVALTAQTPRILAGSAPALTLSSIEEFTLRNENLIPTLQRLYASAADPLFRRGGATLFEAMELLGKLASRIPSNSAPYPAGRFAAQLKQIARLIKANVGLEIAFAEAQGWDTHANQGGATGQMANRLKEFGEVLAAFYHDLGDRMADVMLITLSEFGRTARENGNRGTDHGHANAMFLLGGSVRGGKVFGRWPGLAHELLYEGRDLDLTTDYRRVCAEVLTRHSGPAVISKIFPGYSVPSDSLGVAL